MKQLSTCQDKRPTRLASGSSLRVFDPLDLAE